VLNIFAVVVVVVAVVDHTEDKKRIAK